MVHLHQKQKEIVESKARFKVIRAGRRSGKTMVEIEIMLFKAVSAKDRNVFFIAPTQKQARSIIWEGLKGRLGNVGDPNESRLEMRVPTADGGFSIIYVSGWENRENFRGMKAYHITFDEVDTDRDFFIGWQEIFRPALIDTAGTADFIGTPKKENPNLRRLEKELSQKGEDFEAFHFTTKDNPHIPIKEIHEAQRDLDKNTYQQEILAEYVDDMGALFNYNALVDMFSNSVDGNSKYMTVDIADDGNDSTVFAKWRGLEAYDITEVKGLRTDGIVNYIREQAKEDKILYSQIAVDAIGVGAGVASSPLLNGIIGYKSSFQALKNEENIVRLPNVHYLSTASLVSEFKNLRSQCLFKLADKVNNHQLAIKTNDVRITTHIIEELSTYQDASTGDGKRFATPKEDVKELIGRSPDISDTLIMRMYFELREGLSSVTSEDEQRIAVEMDRAFNFNEAQNRETSTK